MTTHAPGDSRSVCTLGKHTWAGYGLGSGTVLARADIRAVFYGDMRSTGHGLRRSNGGGEVPTPLSSSDVCLSLRFLLSLIVPYSSTLLKGKKSSGRGYPT